ncbi:sulfite exporter TauE/SafE family protein [Nocardioides daphniae]|uniref:Probable membrane transporter protein n=1 Tax=Nocardioides daphniae TaxID=402297 RepID=A0A4P7UDW4_9ACTN|nr:sulfite exporter TauE/SafE family protein [Nocardioides daphniae]QCC78463.1 sulfite exporter TauE/SafE family protein [Nocardioides daphniae]GGD12203.1 UPF0721 transmembrane protein [Nocardioides daphniae]
MVTTLLAIAVGLAIGLTLGALGAGGSILAVPVLLHLFDQSPTTATTGSLIVVGTSALVGAVTARRAGRALVLRGLVFGATATGGTVLGALASTHVPEVALTASFAVLMLLVGALMVRQLRRRETAQEEADDFAEPVLTFDPRLTINWPVALKVLATATAVGLLTGFLGVGGGFLIVPALVLALGLPMRHAAGTSLVVIALTSATALATRAGLGSQPDWSVVVPLAAAAVVGAVAGTGLAGRVNRRALSGAFAALVIGVGIFTGVEVLLG